MIVEELAAAFGLEIDQAAFARAEMLLQKLHVGMLGLAGVDAGLVLGLTEITKFTARAGDQADVTATKLGTTAQALQELSFAADISDSSVEALTVGMGHLSMLMVQAKEGSQEARETIGRFAGSLVDASGKMKAPDQILEDIAEKISKMPKGWEQTGYAMKLFGRGGKDLLPFLIQGRAGIEALRKEAHSLGVVLDTETIEAATKWDEQNKRLGYSLEGLRNKIGGPLIHYLTEIENRMTLWIKANGDLIASRIVGFVDGLARAIRFLTSDSDGARIVWFALTTIMLQQLGVVQKLTWLFGLLETASTGAAFKSLLAWGRATLPLLALAGLIVLITDELWVFINGGDSMLGRLIHWADFMNPSDGPGVEWLKALVSLIEDFSDPKKWERIEKAWDAWIASGGVLPTILNYLNQIYEIVKFFSGAGIFSAIANPNDNGGWAQIGRAAKTLYTGGDAGGSTVLERAKNGFTDLTSSNRTSSTVARHAADRQDEAEQMKHLGFALANKQQNVTIHLGTRNYSVPAGTTKEQLEAWLEKERQRDLDQAIQSANASFNGGSVSTSANDGAGGSRP